MEIERNIHRRIQLRNLIENFVTASRRCGQQKNYPEDENDGFCSENELAGPVLPNCPRYNNDTIDDDKKKTVSAGKLITEKSTNSPRRVRTISHGNDVRSVTRKKSNATTSVSTGRRSVRTRSFDDNLDSLDALTKESEPISTPVANTVSANTVPTGKSLSRRRSITSLTEQLLKLEEFNKDYSNMATNSEGNDENRPNLMIKSFRRLSNIAVHMGVSKANKQANQMDEVYIF